MAKFNRRTQAEILQIIREGIAVKREHTAIAKILNGKGYRTKRGFEWTAANVSRFALERGTRTKVKRNKRAPVTPTMPITTQSTGQLRLDWSPMEAVIEITNEAKISVETKDFVLALIREHARQTHHKITETKQQQ